MRLLIVFALPMLVGNIFQQVYNLADSIIVGNLIGPDALGAIGATSSVTFLFFAICNGISSGGGVVTSQFFGMGDAKKVRKSIVNTAYVMMVMPAFVGGIAFALAELMLKMLATPAELMDDALSYTRLMCVGIIFVSLYNFSSSMLRALGDSKTPPVFPHFLLLPQCRAGFAVCREIRLGSNGRRRRDGDFSVRIGRDLYRLCHPYKSVF